VPVLFLAGDQALCDEARARCESLITVPTFSGLGHSITSLTPEESAGRIREGVARAVSAGGGWWPTLAGEFHTAIRFTNAAEGYRKSFYPQARLASDLEVVFETGDYFEVLRFLNFMAMSGGG